MSGFGTVTVSIFTAGGGLPGTYTLIIFLPWLSMKGVMLNSLPDAGRREDDPLDVMIEHAIQQRQAIGNVVAIVLARVFHRLADIRVGTEMHHAEKLVAAEDLVQQIPIADGPVVDSYPLGHRLGVPCGEIVENDGGPPGVD